MIYNISKLRLGFVIVLMWIVCSEKAEAHSHLGRYGNSREVTFHQHTMEGSNPTPLAYETILVPVMETPMHRHPMPRRRSHHHRREPFRERGRRRRLKKLQKEFLTNPTLHQVSPSTIPEQVVLGGGNHAYHLSNDYDVAYQVTTQSTGSEPMHFIPHQTGYMAPPAIRPLYPPTTVNLPSPTVPTGIHHYADPVYSDEPGPTSKPSAHLHSISLIPQRPIFSQEPPFPAQLNNSAQQPSIPPKVVTTQNPPVPTHRTTIEDLIASSLNPTPASKSPSSSAHSTATQNSTLSIRQASAPQRIVMPDESQELEESEEELEHDIDVRIGDGN